MSGSAMPPGADRGQQRGLLIILSSPSGAGKTTLAHRLMEEFPAVSFSISMTTRASRGQEVDGVDYHFVDDATFDRLIAEGAMAEWAEVHGNRYGTARATIDVCLAEGRDMIFDIDWQGGNALAERWPNDVLKVFIFPPSMAVLESRLRTRATDAPDVIAKRLRQAVAEMEHYTEYDYVVVNDQLDDAYATLRAIYQCRLQSQRRTDDVSQSGSPLGHKAASESKLGRDMQARAAAASVGAMRTRIETLLSSR